MHGEGGGGCKEGWRKPGEPGCHESPEKSLKEGVKMTRAKVLLRFDSVKVVGDLDKGSFKELRGQTDC